MPVESACCTTDSQGCRPITTRQLRAVEVGVCYPWAIAEDAHSNLAGDTEMKLLRKIFQPMCDEAAKRIRDKFADAPENPVRFRRVRATAGNLVHKSLLECIDNKDIVIGHLASLDRSALVVAAPHGPEAEGPSRTRTESAALSRSRGISDPLVNRLESAPRAR